MAAFRIDPKMPPGAYKTYQILAPLATHHRPATCAEAGCAGFTHGWVTTVDESTELGQRQAHYIRHDPTRSCQEARTAAGLTQFTYRAGQRCFTAHTVPLDRPERFVVRGGDYRGNPRGEIREHTRPEFWQEDFADHQDRLQTAIEKG